MNFRCPIHIVLSVLMVGLLTAPCLATDYNEAISGDLSNSGLTPTSIGSLTLGANSVLGTTGRGGNGLDRDYFTFTVPANFTLVSMTELSGTTVGGDVSFIGVQAGNKVTVGTNPTSAAGLLGWTHYGVADINVDILPRMGVPSFGSTGFTTPLSAGNYAFWVQDFNVGVFTYGFRLGVQAVPEPGSLALFTGLGVGGSLLTFSRLKKRRIV